MVKFRLLNILYTFIVLICFELREKKTTTKNPHDVNDILFRSEYHFINQTININKVTVHNFANMI